MLIFLKCMVGDSAYPSYVTSMGKSVGAIVYQKEIERYSGGVFGITRCDIPDYSYTYRWVKKLKVRR